MDKDYNVWSYLVGLVISLLFGLVCARIAGRKGYSALMFGVLGFFFSCITLIIALVLPRRDAGPAAPRS